MSRNGDAIRKRGERRMRKGEEGEEARETRGK